jgi:hypothetical protein
MVSLRYIADILYADLGETEAAYGMWSLAAQHGDFAPLVGMAKRAFDKAQEIDDDALLKEAWLEEAHAWGELIVTHGDRLIADRPLTQELLETDGTCFWGALLWAQAAAVNYPPAQERMQRLRTQLGAEPVFAADPDRAAADLCKEARVSIYHSEVEWAPGWPWLVEEPSSWQERYDEARKKLAETQREAELKNTSHRVLVELDPNTGPVSAEKLLIGIGNGDLHASGFGFKSTSDLHVEFLDTYTALITVDEIEDLEQRYERIRNLEWALLECLGNSYVYEQNGFKVKDYSGGSEGEPSRP